MEYENEYTSKPDRILNYIFSYSSKAQAEGTQNIKVGTPYQNTLSLNTGNDMRLGVCKMKLSELNVVITTTPTHSKSFDIIPKIIFFRLEDINPSNIIDVPNTKTLHGILTLTNDIKYTTQKSVEEEHCFVYTMREENGVKFECNTNIIKISFWAYDDRTTANQTNVNTLFITNKDLQTSYNGSEIPYLNGINLLAYIEPTEQAIGTLTYNLMFTNHITIAGLLKIIIK